jgi:flagellar biosynthesis anti-sigma factor FlgM
MIRAYEDISIMVDKIYDSPMAKSTSAEKAHKSPSQASIESSRATIGQKTSDIGGFKPSQEIAALTDIIANMNKEQPFNADKVASLKISIENGTYTPNSAIIASKMRASEFGG